MANDARSLGLGQQFPRFEGSRGRRQFLGIVLLQHRCQKLPGGQHHFHDRILRLLEQIKRSPYPRQAQ